MFVGRAWMSHSQGLSVERVSAAMVYEQAIGVCSALLAIAVLFPFWEYRPGLTALSLLAIPGAGGPDAPADLRAARRAGAPPVPPAAAGRHDGVRRRPRPSSCSSRSTGWSPAPGAWLLARAITGLEIDALPLCIVAYALAYVAGMIAFFIPSGIGVREAVLTASLAQPSFPAASRSCWALLLRIWVTAMELLFVGLVVGVDLLLRRRSEA